MDPLTHTLTGTTMAGAGLRRASPLATAALILAANAPDIDVFAYWAGEYTALAFRRGWTHGPLAWLALPLAVTGVVLAYDRWVRRRRRPDAAPARAGPILAVSALGVATHPFLDWLNNYGIRFLMPFSDRWFYGDTLFIVDPWIWLLLGTATCLGYGTGRGAVVAWSALALAASTLVLTSPLVPAPARVVWLVGLAVALACRWRRVSPRPAARVALAAVAVYIAAGIAMNAVAVAAAREEAVAMGIGPVADVMSAPVPANPFASSLLVATPRAYHRGEFRLLGGGARLDTTALAIAPPAADVVIRAASTAPDARDYLTWSRFPFYRVDVTADGYLVHIGDARYTDEPRAGGLGGLTVRLDANLRPVP